MRYLLYADVQAGASDERLYSDPTTPLQLYRVDKFYADIARIAKAHKVDGIIDLGDTTDDREAIPVSVIHRLDSWLKPFRKIRLNSYKLIGNHEQALRSQSVHVGPLFSRYFKIISRLKCFPIGDGVVGIFCSYPYDEKTTVEKVRQLVSEHKNRKMVLFGHFQVIGCHMASGLSLTGIPEEIFEGIDISFLGHVHRPQSLPGNVHYVGSPFQQNYGERGDRKRVGIFDTKTFATEWIPLTGFPEYYKLTVDEFISTVNPESEDRYSVTITSRDEADKLFACPLSARADVVYDYGQNPNVPKTEEAADFSFEALTREWVMAHPPSAAGIDVKKKYLIEQGRLLAMGTV